MGLNKYYIRINLVGQPPPLPAMTPYNWMNTVLVRVQYRYFESWKALWWLLFSVPLTQLVMFRKGTGLYDQLLHVPWYLWDHSSTVSPVKPKTIQHDFQSFSICLNFLHLGYVSLHFNKCADLCSTLPSDSPNQLYNFGKFLYTYDLSF